MASPLRRAALTWLFRLLSSVGLSALVTQATSARAAELALSLNVGPDLQAREWFARVEPQLSFSSEPLKLELAAPLRLAMGPLFEGEPGAYRERDFDSSSDAGRVLRRLEVTLGRDAFSLRVGPLSHARLGHGTLVQGFTNELDPEQAPAGAMMAIRSGPLAAELLASDITRSELFAGTLSLEPLTLLGFATDRFHLLVSGAVDGSAPTPGEARQVSFIGAGSDLVLLRFDSFRLTPYFDANARAFEHGVGLHAGLMLDIDLTLTSFSLQAEWRRARGAYLPDYFDVAYQLERLAWSDALPKSSVEREEPWDSALVTLRASFASIDIQTSVSTRPGGALDGSLVLSTNLPLLNFAAVGVWRGESEGRPERLLMAAQSTLRFTDMLYLWSHAGRLYELGSAQRGEGPKPLWLLGAGAGMAMGL